VHQSGREIPCRSSIGRNARDEALCKFLATLTKFLIRPPDWIEPRDALSARSHSTHVGRMEKGRSPAEHHGA